jgi:hypothetical protein
MILTRKIALFFRLIPVILHTLLSLIEGAATIIWLTGGI